MLLVITYALMIFDLVMTLMHHEDAGELNPLFQKILAGEPLLFIYLKLAFNSSAAIGIILLYKYRPILGHLFCLLGLFVYGFVAYIHIEVYRINHGQDPLLPGLATFYESLFS